LRPNPKVLFLIERARILRQYGGEFFDETVAQKIRERTLGGVPEDGYSCGSLSLSLSLSLYVRDDCPRGILEVL